MQKKTKLNYSNFAIPPKSKGRVFEEKNSVIRSSYQRDRDRIIHSTAFRRLKHKTQVFVNTEDDHYRTRITHSIEVSQIARTLARYFNLNEDLCETISLAHDLGHTPFGHAGEEILNECMQNDGGFDHNIQTLRVVTLLEKKSYKYYGLNLTYETLDGLLKHNGPINDKKKLDSILGEKFLINKINFSNRASLEAQIASISDDIAYNSHDLEDGLREKLFYLEDLKQFSLISPIIKKYDNKFNNNELIFKQIVRDIINLMVKDVIKNTEILIKKEKIKSIKNVYKLNKDLVCFSKKINSFDKEIKKFLKEKMYYSPKVLLKTNEGKKIIEFLFKNILKKPHDFIDKKNSLNRGLSRDVSDFIAGMTDRYAINIYNSLK
tara:strand:- start:3241 stop:4374 length:1134 start_codon:yes stop_codon:yes gene_type:complete